MMNEVNGGGEKLVRPESTPASPADHTGIRARFAMPNVIHAVAAAASSAPPVPGLFEVLLRLSNNCLSLPQLAGFCASPHRTGITYIDGVVPIGFSKKKRCTSRTHVETFAERATGKPHYANEAQTSCDPQDT